MQWVQSTRLCGIGLPCENTTTRGMYSLALLRYLFYYTLHVGQRLLSLRCYLLQLKTRSASGIKHFEEFNLEGVRVHDNSPLF